MKTLKKLLALCFIICFISCSDDQSMELNEQTVIGSWSLIELEADTDVTTNFAGIPITTTTNSVGENFDYTLIFTEDTYTVVGGYDLVTTANIGGETVEETQSITGISETGTYTYNEEDKTITLAGNLVDFEADDVDMSEFSEEQDINITFDDDGNLVMTQMLETTVEEEGLEYAITIEAQIVFARN